MSNPESADCHFPGHASVVGGLLDEKRFAQAHHQDWTTAVEARSIGHLPDVLDPVCVPVDETGSEVTKGAFDCFGVSLEGGFAPSDEPVCGFDTHEKPAWRDAEKLDIDQEGEAIKVGNEHVPRFLRSGLSQRW